MGEVQDNAVYPYGFDFQHALMAMAVQDPGFLASYEDIIEPRYFESPVLQTVSKIILGYYKSYAEPPAQQTLNQLVYEHVSGLPANMQMQIDQFYQFAASLYTTEIRNSQFIKDRAVKFAQRQAFKHALIHGITILKRDGDIEDAQDLVDRAMTIGIRRDMGDDLYEVIESLPHKWAEMVGGAGKIPTCFPILNEATYGGVRKGELFIIQGIPKFGKCLGPDARVWSPYGGYTRMVDFPSQGWSVGEVANGTDVIPILAKAANGRKKVYDVYLRSGRVIRQITGNHPVRTCDGYTPVSKLSKGDAVAAPNRLPLEVSQAWEYPELAYALGVFLGGGCLMADSSIISAEEGVDDVPNAVLSVLPEEWSIEVNRTGSHVRFVNKLRNGKRPCSRRNLLTEWLRSLGVFGMSAAAKRVPKIVWQGGCDVVRGVLAGLWDTDGWVQSKGTGCAEYCTVSDYLAHDVLTMLHVLGIYAVVRRNYADNAWLVRVTGRDSLRQFGKQIRLRYKKKADRLQAILAKPIKRSTERGSYWQRLPVQYRRFLGSQQRSKSCRVSKDMFKQQVADSSQHSFALSVFWDEVVDIKPVGRMQTYDLQASKESQSFVTEGVVVHNSTTLISLGGYAIRCGYKVLHVTIGDLKQFDVELKYATYLAQQNIKEMMYGGDAYAFARLKDAHIKPNQLRIKYFSPFSLSVPQLRSYISWLRTNSGFFPDLLILDYPDKMYRKHEDSYSEMGKIYMEIKTLLDDFDIACWAASQSNRGAADAKVNRAANVAESWDKIANADGIIPCSQTDEERAQGKARLYIEMVRFGIDHWTQPVHINYGMSTVSSVGNIDAYTNLPEQLKAKAAEFCNHYSTQRVEVAAQQHQQMQAAQASLPEGTYVREDGYYGMNRWDGQRYTKYVWDGQQWHATN